MAFDLSVLSGATSLARQMVGDGSNPNQTYATTFSTPSGDFTFVPDSVIQKGIVSGDNTYWLPAALNKDSLKDFASKATYVDLSNVPHSNITSLGNSWGDWVTGRTGQSPTGYLIPGGSAIIDSGGISTVPTKQIGSISGLAQDESGNYVYSTTGGRGNQYINNTGEVHDPYITYSSPFGSFGVSLGQSLTKLGPILPLALNAVSPGLGTAIAAGVALGSGNTLGGLAALTGIPGMGETASAAGLGGVLSAAQTANQAVNLVNALDKGNTLGALASGAALTGQTGTQIGDTGITVSNALNAANLANALSTGNQNAALASALSLADSKNQLTSDNKGQPENIGLLDSQTTQTQAPDTQELQDDVVVNANLQDNQSNASGQGNAMDILDFLGGDTSPDNIDIGGGWNPAGNIYDQISQDDINAMADVGMNLGEGADLNAMGDVGMGSPTGSGGGGIGGMAGGGGGGSAGGSSGGTDLASMLKGLLPTSALGKAALASGAGGLLQGLIGANASNKAAQLQADAAAASRAQQLQMFNTLNQQQAPYRGAGYGALNQIQGMLPGQYTQYDAQGNPMGTGTGTGYLTQQFTPEMFQQGIDPGYAFRLQQGQMAAQRQGNVAGGGLGGNVMRGLQDYTQGQASQEFGNAFNRFQTQRSNIYNTLAGIAGIGQASQQQANQLGTNLANAQTNLNVGQAGAQAAGQIGQAGAYGGALGGINQALLLSQLPDIAAAMKGQ